MHGMYLPGAVIHLPTAYCAFISSDQWGFCACEALQAPSADTLAQSGYSTATNKTPMSILNMHLLLLTSYMKVIFRQGLH